MWTVMITRQWLGDLSLWCGRTLFWRLKRDIEGFFGLCEAWWSYTSSNIAFILWGNRANLSPNVFSFKLKSVNSTGSSPTPISGTHLISFSIMSSFNAVFSFANFNDQIRDENPDPKPQRLIYFFESSFGIKIDEWLDLQRLWWTVCIDMYIQTNSCG